ncbi:MAG: GumC family protein [Leptolyngbyaceae cyanobacterium]
METRRSPEEIDLQQYWMALKRRWPVLVAAVATFTGLGTFAAVMQRPSYEASGSLLIQSNRVLALAGIGERAGGGGGGLGFGQLQSIGRGGDPMATQAAIVQSRPLLEKVITQLQLRDEAGQTLTPGDLKLEVRPTTGTDILQVSYLFNDPQVAAAVVNEVMKAYVTENLLMNRAESSAASKFVKNQLPKAEAELEQAAEALRQFKARNQVVDLDRESAAAVTNLSNLNEQLNDTQARLADVSAQQAALRQQLKNSVTQAVDVASLSEAPGVQEALVELQRIQARLASERTRYTTNHPSIVTLEKQESALNTLLQDRVSQILGSQSQLSPGAIQMGPLKRTITQNFAEAEVQRLGLQNRLSALSQLWSAYKRRADVLPNLERQQESLQQRLASARRNYETLLTRLQDLEVIENQNVGNARIIQPATVPEKPTGWLHKFYPIGGALAGLLLGTLAAFLIDAIDRSIKSIKEAQALFGYTTLGMIPRFGLSGALSRQSQLLEGVSPRVIVTTAPRTVIHEAYQMLQANLKFVSLDKKVKTLVVTSSVPQEGKSEVTANLAATIAQTGRRVLLVDADMRSPSQHHLWGLTNLVGLSNMVVGQEDVHAAVQPVTDHLSVLTAGVIPPNPMALIDSESMAAFIQSLAQGYDYVLFDTPPLVGAADAAVLGKLTDGVLLVVRPGLVDSASAGTAKTLLERSDPNILGIIANAVDVKREPEPYFSYTAPRVDSQTEAMSQAKV